MTLSLGHVREGVHHYEARVYYEHTDAEGVVYHANYLKFAEQARTEFSRYCGISQTDLKHVYTCVLIVTQLNIKYEKSARLDDIIQVRTKLGELSNAMFCFHQSLWVKGVKIASLEVNVASVDSEKWRIKRMPEDVMKKIKEGFHG